ncbi:hypothetical protein EMIHUDRAFT_107102 [Emiliania huxleyi CCMP1516]|uniref:Uncharacterized protein n=2 Tax=Emiliania huxleyi TaxID=2903 RepID=A0A0D3I3X2_EMIH1|nr:hypothetical protein EMIHUDRAFT_107102 [Emiliania huxleyi CCMP1516]EOD05957.1 hypothetical protein EMIHUDRAFT_107102 [Emiliania huxleyi CCMP1516]|eukprot:XP_005758386.1 hypothetical protein EMIHUDRAFT_107102 [Emiliania huxleyi CCMP1516]
MSELLNTKHQHIESLDVAPDGLVALATSSLTGEVWDGRLVVLRCAADAARAEVIASVETEVGNAAVAWAGSGLVASGDDAGNVTVWRFGTGAAGAAADEERLPVAVYSEHDQAVTCVACAPGGARLASGSADGTVRVWACGAAAQAERCLQHKPAEPWLECGVAAAAWLSAELLSTCDEEGKVRLWDLRVPAAVRAVAREGCGSGCLAPLDETSLASGTRAGDVVKPPPQPRSLSLVDLSTLAARPVPAAHSDVVSGVGWLPPSDGAHASLLSCGWDKRLVATEVQ